MNTPCEEEDQDAMKRPEIIIYIYIYVYVYLVQKYDVINTIIVSFGSMLNLACF